MYINYSLFSSDLNFNHLFFFRSSILYHLLPSSPTPCWGYLFCTRFDSCFFCLFISALCPCIIFSSLPFYLAFFCFIASLLSSCCFFQLYFVFFLLYLSFHLTLHPNSSELYIYLAFHLLLPLFMQGLEVSKPGRYHTLNSDNFLEMSDSGVEFTSSGLPLDSDTDAAMTYASHKPLLNAASPPAISEGSHSEGLEATVVPDGDLSASQTPDSALSPISNPHSLAAATPDGSLRGAASPGTASRGTAESDTAKSEGGAESGEGEQKEETAQST